MKPIELDNIDDIGNLYHKRDLVVKCDITFKTASGIIASVMPEVINDRPQCGVVVKIGKKITEFNIGDTIYFDKISGLDIHTKEFKDGVLYILLSEDRILGKLEKN